ncbi:hypothetical protein [Salirhabdus salicampi]|uniref:hypothetical protein n=1 Tax=Salirhabdus salicampi TaxID=476102 RepID=UPI0020C2238D|nr:hypothetical protein [Salirhabdus salicampi]MCP8616077.1 hypothetical protein [Salirhabdus salicampi]
MQSMQDVVYNWLTIYLVAESRPKDQAAKDTAALFRTMLTEDHAVKDLHVEKKEDMYLVICETNDETRSFRFPLELIECIRNQMDDEPEKFPNYVADERPSS